MAYDYKNDPNNPDAKPLYNDNILQFWNWFDKVWDCNDWMTWHKSMVKKYGLPTANSRWLKDWNNLATGSSAIDCRTFNSAFRDYTKKVGLFEHLYDGSGVLEPVLQVVGSGNDVVHDVTNTVSSTSKLIKTLIPILLIIAVVFVIIYFNKKVKS